MRQRKVKDLEERFCEYDYYFLKDLQMLKGRLAEVFCRENGIYLELGCGKGQFILSQAEAHPERNFLAVEGQASVLFRGLQKLADKPLTNVRFACAFINQPTDFFSEEEISGIYLNFSDPWPKLRHAKRRLTHRSYLFAYHRMLKPQGCVEIKTDNDGLYSFTLEEVQRECAQLFKVIENTDNLHETDLKAQFFTTEYEDKFRAQKKNIHYLKLEKR